MIFKAGLLNLGEGMPATCVGHAIVLFREDMFKRTPPKPTLSAYIHIPEPRQEELGSLRINSVGSSTGRAIDYQVEICCFLS